MISFEDFETKVQAANERLLSRFPMSIRYENSDNLRENSSLNESALTQEIDNGRNIYAIWARENASSDWTVMYIGQRSMPACKDRIKQHLFHTPSGTQSKLLEVKNLVQQGYEIGLSTVLVNPDSMRLSVEDKLIYTNTPDTDALPWNNKSRNVPLLNA